MKCSICGESLSRGQVYCPRCGFNPDIKGLSEEEIRKAFEEIDQLQSDFDLFEWIEKRRMERKTEQNTTLWVREDEPIEGILPEVSGVLGDFQNVVQKKKKRKHLFRYGCRTVKVRREVLEPADPYYDDVLPEDWGEWNKKKRPSRFRQQCLLILMGAAVMVASIILILKVFLI